MQSFTGEATIPKVLLLTCFSSNANMEKPWVLVTHSAKNISKQRKIIFPNQIDRHIQVGKYVALYTVRQTSVERLS